jgi:hypothetical protein
MKWLPLESRMLSAVAYDASKQILHLRFRHTGYVYRYFEFAAADYPGLPERRIKRPVFPFSHPR